MDNVRWIVQQNLVNHHDYTRMVEAAHKLSLEFNPVVMIPFSDELPIVDLRPFTFDVLYGACGFVSKMQRSGQFTPGAWINNNFRPSVYAQKWQEDYLNFDGRLTTLNNLRSKINYTEEVSNLDELIFVRPDQDDKLFAGQIIDWCELEQWVDKLQISEMNEVLNAPIWYSSPKNIFLEWRLFIVEGKVVGGSMYRAQSRLKQCADVPDRVLRFAERKAAEWSPARVFVLDVCKESHGAAGEYRIVEAGVFNSAGFYAADVETIMRTVSEFAAKEHTSA